MAKKILIRILLLLVIIIISNYVYKYTFYKQDVIENGYEAFDILRDHFWNNENVFWWYKQNMVIYAKKGSLVCNEFEIEKHVKSLVHPDLYSKKTTKPKYLKNRKALIKLLLNTLKSFVK